MGLQIVGATPFMITNDLVRVREDQGKPLPKTFQSMIGDLKGTPVLALAVRIVNDKKIKGRAMRSLRKETMHDEPPRNDVSIAGSPN
jgi:hypothetical protein